MSDSINHPSHYTQGNIEVIDFLEDQKLDFRLSNAIKYICRAGKKDPRKEVEDLKKAIWYINRYIEKTAEPNVTALNKFSAEQLIKWIRENKDLHDMLAKI